jgi:hypothetical protein
VHHARADIVRLYVSGKKGGRGLIKVGGAYKAQVVNIATCFNKVYEEEILFNSSHKRS